MISDSDTHQNLLIKYGWITGIIGAVAIIFTSFYGAYSNAAKTGWRLGSFIITSQYSDTILYVLFAVALLMILSEFVVVRLHTTAFKLLKSKEPISKRFSLSFLESIRDYLTGLLVVFSVMAFYRLANIYGFADRVPYFLPWHCMAEKLLRLVLWFGFPYLFVTNFVFRHQVKTQKLFYILFDASKTLWKNIRWGSHETDKAPLSNETKVGLLGIAVKVFFLPVITVFFCRQYAGLDDTGNKLISFFSYKNETFSARVIYTHLIGIFISCDLAIAWTGYAISTRWLYNRNISVEQSLKGWIVTLLCYPPFYILAMFFSVPDESSFLEMSCRPLVYFSGTVSVIGFFIFLVSTIMLGIRFSNLTNRGIVTNGIYRLVRHPAYASKNIAWWCTMLPYIIFTCYTKGITTGLPLFIGLCGTTCIYYLRAITEEAHLNHDPVYVEYCKLVRYRFVPGVI